MEAKIYKIANMSMDYYFQNDRACGNFQREAADAGLIITPETTYMEAAYKIKQYTVSYPDDRDGCIDLISLFLYPICRFAGQLVWRGDARKANTEKNTENKKKKSTNNSFEGDLHTLLAQHHMKEFYVWMDEYVSVLESIFPEEDYLQYFNDEIHLKAPFEKRAPILMRFVLTILRDKNETYSKYPLLMKFMVDPYAGLYRKAENSDIPNIV